MQVMFKRFFLVQYICAAVALMASDVASCKLLTWKPNRGEPPAVPDDLGVRHLLLDLGVPRLDLCDEGVDHRRCAGLLLALGRAALEPLDAPARVDELHAKQTGSRRSRSTTTPTATAP